MKKSLLILIATFFFAGLSIAQDRKVIATMAEDAEPTRGQDPYITIERGNCAVREKLPDLTLGNHCTMLLDNCTDLCVDYYINGIYSGTLVPMTGSPAFTYAGRTSFYAVSVDKTKTWGPLEFDCTEELLWRFTNEGSECFEEDK